MLTTAITQWRDTPRPPRPDFLPLQYHELFHQQSVIGWNHILAGHITTLWSTVQEQINPKTPSTWVCYFIRTLWQLIYNNWKLRCDKNHGVTTQDKRQRALLKLTPKVQSLYNKQNLIEPSDHHIFSVPINELLELPTHTIENWLFKAEIRVKDSIKRQQIMTQQNIQPIHNFFQRVIIPIVRQRRNIPDAPPATPPRNIILPRRRGNIIATTIRHFFQRLIPPEIDPHIPIPRNDDRPP